MARYNYFDNSHGLFLTLCHDNQLILGFFEHTVNYLIDQLGASAYPPVVMLKIIVTVHGTTAQNQETW